MTEENGPEENGPVEVDAGEKNTIKPEEIYDTKYVDYISGLVTENLEKKSSRRRDSMKIVVSLTGFALTAAFAVLAFFGVSNFNSIKQDIINEVLIETKSPINKIVIDRVGEAFKSRQSELEKKHDALVAYLDFTLIVNTIEETRNVRDSQREQAISLLLNSAKNPEIVKLNGFPIVLQKFLTHLFVTSKGYMFDKIEKKIGTIIASNAKMVISTVAHYGMRIIVEVSPSDDLKNSFRQYVGASVKFDRKSVVLPFVIAVSYKENGFERNKHTNAYFQEAKFIKTKKQKRKFVEVFRRLKKWKFRSKSITMKRVGEIFFKLSKEYKSELQELRSQSRR